MAKDWSKYVYVCTVAKQRRLKEFNETLRAMKSASGDTRALRFCCSIYYTIRGLAPEAKIMPLRTSSNYYVHMCSNHHHKKNICVIMFTS